MREHWTDDRMDDLVGRVNEGFNRVDTDLRSLRVEVAGLRTESNARFDAMQRVVIQAAVGLISAFVGLMAAVLGLVATQL